MQTPDMRSQEYGGLTGRISAADEHHVVSFAQSSFDWRCPVGNTHPFEPIEVFDFRASI